MNLKKIQLLVNLKETIWTYFSKHVNARVLLVGFFSFCFVFLLNKCIKINLVQSCYANFDYRGKNLINLCSSAINPTSSFWDTFVPRK